MNLKKLNVSALFCCSIVFLSTTNIRANAFERNRARHMEAWQKQKEASDRIMESHQKRAEQMRKEQEQNRKEQEQNRKAQESLQPGKEILAAVRKEISNVDQILNDKVVISEIEAARNPATGLIEVPDDTQGIIKMNGDFRQGNVVYTTNDQKDINIGSFKLTKPGEYESYAFTTPLLLDKDGAPVSVGLTETNARYENGIPAADLHLVSKDDQGKNESLHLGSIMHRNEGSVIKFSNAKEEIANDINHVDKAAPHEKIQHNENIQHEGVGPRYDTVPNEENTPSSDNSQEGSMPA